MATYHCPQCQNELKKGPIPGWVRWVIGPLVGYLLCPLICDQHGRVDHNTLAPEERQMVSTRRTLGIVLGVVLNVVFLIIVFLLAVND